MSTGNGARCLLVSVIYAANVRGHLWDAKGQPVCKSEVTLVGDRRAPLPAVLPAEECPGRAEGALAEPPGSRLALRAGHAVPGAAAQPSSWQGALVPSRVALPPVALPSPQSELPALSLAPRRVQFSAAGPSGVCSSERDVGCSRWKLPCRLCVLFTPFRRCVAFVRIRHDCPPEQAHSRLNTSHLEASWGEAAPGP